MAGTCLPTVGRASCTSMNAVCESADVSDTLYGILNDAHVVYTTSGLCAFVRANAHVIRQYKKLCVFAYATDPRQLEADLRRPLESALGLDADVQLVFSDFQIPVYPDDSVCFIEWRELRMKYVLNPSVLRSSSVETPKTIQVQTCTECGTLSQACVLRSRRGGRITDEPTIGSFYCLDCINSQLTTKRAATQTTEFETRKRRYPFDAATVTSCQS